MAEKAIPYTAASLPAAPFFTALPRLNPTSQIKTRNKKRKTKCEDPNSELKLI
jgi:hypothetical protein